MKAYSKIELARAAGVSGETFRRWLRSDKAVLEEHHVGPKTKILPPQVVRYLCEKYDIEIEVKQENCRKN